MTGDVDDQGREICRIEPLDTAEKFATVFFRGRFSADAFSTRPHSLELMNNKKVVSVVDGKGACRNSHGVELMKVVELKKMPQGR